MESKYKSDKLKKSRKLLNIHNNKIIITIVPDYLPHPLLAIGVLISQKSPNKNYIVLVEGFFSAYLI